MTLGDKFPKDFISKHLEGKIIPGTVIYYECDFTTPPKPKFIIISSNEENCLVLVINSEINEFKKTRKILYDLQLKIDKNQCNFLTKKTSYIDCSQVHKVNKKIILDQVLKDPSRIKGVLDISILQEIVKTVGKAKTINEIHRKIITSSLINA